jgi:hypothetical protein
MPHLELRFMWRGVAAPPRRVVSELGEPMAISPGPCDQPPKRRPPPSSDRGACRFYERVPTNLGPSRHRTSERLKRSR